MNNFKENIGWIFLGNAVHAVFQFLLGVLAARVFAAGDYGLLNYGGAFVTFFTSVGTLGFAGVINKYFAQDPDQAGKYLGTALIARALFALGAMAVMQLIAPAGQLRLLLLCQSASMMFVAGDDLIQWYHFQGRAQQVANLRMVGFALSALWRLWAIFGARSLVLYAAGVSMEMLIFLILLTLDYRREFGGRFTFHREVLEQMLGESYPFITAAVLSTIYAQTDKLMLGSLVSAEAVGHYSVAVTLAGAITIVPSALITGFRPEIMRRKTQGGPLYRRRLGQLYCLVFWISVAYSLFITIFGGGLVWLIYGADYAGAVPPLSIIVWYTAFSFFGSVNNIYLICENKTKWVQILTLLGAGLNIALNALLIPPMGTAGAALASLLTQFVTNFLLLAAIPSLRELIVIQLAGITGKDFRKSS